jgi:uncharacterized membrane protein
MATIDTSAQTDAQAQAQTQRVEQFKQEIADMRLRDPATARDRLLLRTGVALMVIGLAFAVGAYFVSHSTTNGLLQNDMQVSAVIGLCVTVIGAALFLRYSMAQFLRFWLARLSYEQQHQTDRLIESLKRP